MRHALVPLASLSLVLVAGTAFAQAPSAARARAPLQAPVEELGLDEVERAFRAADLDGDGKLDRAEFARALEVRDGRRAQAGRERADRRIAAARREAGDLGGEGPSLGARLAEALERAEPRLLGAAGREAFAELRREAIGLARTHAAGGAAGREVERFLDALAGLEAKATRGELRHDDLLALRNDLRKEGPTAADGSRGSGEEKRGPAGVRRRAPDPAAGGAQARPAARAASGGERR